MWTSSRRFLPFCMIECADFLSFHLFVTFLYPCITVIDDFKEHSTCSLMYSY
jgi:hypothetical protein